MRSVFVTLMTLGLLAGCELPDPKNRSTDDDRVVSSSSDLTIGYGSLGPVRVGMTQREALDTGLFDRDAFDTAQKCKASTLRWKEQFKGVEVQTDKAGTIRSLRIFGPGAKTLYGTQVGSDLADIRGSYAGALAGPAKVGTSGSGLFVRKEKAWIGFLFDKDPDELDVLDKVTFIEVTEGARPQLLRQC